MSKLPQRKKTPEEIAMLRESMGLGGPAPAFPPSPELQPHAAPAPQPSPSLPQVAPGTPAIPPAAPRPPVEAKPVRSLRRSEREPSAAQAPRPAPSVGSTQLPVQRHSDAELNQLRRIQSLTNQAPGAFVIAKIAHPILVGLGYLCVVSAAILPIVNHFFTSISMYVPAGLCLAGLVIAAFIFFKKKLSRHHAGFITTIAVFTLIFGSLYYFPHIWNAT